MCSSRRDRSRRQAAGRPATAGHQHRDEGAQCHDVGLALLGTEIEQRPAAPAGTGQRERAAELVQQRTPSRGDGGELGGDVAGERAQPSELGGERGRLGSIGQAAVEQEVPDVLEGAPLRQLDGVVLAVVVAALLSPRTSPMVVSVTTTPLSPAGTESSIVHLLVRDSVRDSVSRRSVHHGFNECQH